MRRSSGEGIPRLIELGLALVGLISASPLLVLAAILIKATSPGPVLFRQERVGQNGRLFILLKFRTMQVNNQGAQVTARGDSRVTPVGRVLRKTKLDELPELWNIVRGELSLVGPRPEVPKYVDVCDPLWEEVLKVKPGITDPVTLKLRNEEELLGGCSDAERFYLEKLQRYKLTGYVEYLRNRTWRTDVEVLLRTVVAVVFPVKAPPPELDEIERALGKVHNRGRCRRTPIQGRSET